jgi:putative transposase
VAGLRRIQWLLSIGISGCFASERAIEGEWPYLWLDATYVKVRQAGRIVSVAVIIAVGVNDDGRREILGMTVGASEAETFWTEFLRSLARRGLRGVKLAISDAHEGLKSGVAKVLHATWQRCRVHTMRNLLAHAGRQGRGVAAAFIATAFAQNDAAAAKAQWRKVADQLRPKPPKLAATMDEAEVDVLAYMDFPMQHRTKIHSTNPIERLNKEVKRRTDVGGIFPNEASIVRLVGAVLLEQNDVYGPPRPCKGFRLTTTDPVLAVVYPALSRGNTPQALMVFADRRPDKWTSSQRLASFIDLCRTRSDPVRHHRLLPSQASAARKQRRPGYAAAGIADGRRYASARVSIAHSARAVLCATATAATFTGLRPIRAVSHGRGATSLRNVAPTTARAPWIRRARK